MHCTYISRVIHIFYVVGAIMYIFMCVPATGYTAPAIAQNRVGPLPAHSPSAGGRSRARSGHLQRRGASCPCSSPPICWAGLQVCRGTIGPLASKIALSRRFLRWELGLECRNSADHAVSALHLYFSSYSLFLCCRCNYVYIYVCPCHRLYRSGHRSEPSGTSSGPFT